MWNIQTKRKDYSFNLLAKQILDLSLHCSCFDSEILFIFVHFQVYIQPSADEAERVRLSNVADCPVSPDVPQTMLLNMNGADGDVECKIIAPSGREDDCFITPLGEGEHSVRFVPKEEGTHYLVTFSAAVKCKKASMQNYVFGCQ